MSYKKLRYKPLLNKVYAIRLNNDNNREHFIINFLLNLFLHVTKVMLACETSSFYLLLLHITVKSDHVRKLIILWIDGML